MANFSLETSNKFGKLYVFTRLAMLICILIQLIALIIALAQGISHASVGWIIWWIFIGLSMLIGLLAAWREHFLTAVIFAIIEIVLAICGFTGGIGVLAFATVLLIICSIGFALMLYFSGSRDLSMPQIC